MPESENKRGGLAGEKARKWRRGIGALAEDGVDARTRKFQLELPDGENAFDFAEAARLFDVAEGTGPGSLAGLLCAVHLSGFRVFSSAGAARKFRPNIAAKNATIAQDDERPMETLSPDDAEFFPHKIAALAARESRADGIAEEKIPREFATRLFSGTSPNALSWLFGAGLADLLANPEVADDEAARLLDADIRRVRQLREFARAVPLPPPFCGKANYADFRVAVAGKLQGWLSNYWRRLNELRARVENPSFAKPPAELDDSRLDPLLRRANIRRDDIRDAANALPRAFADARDALDILAGLRETLPGPADIAKFDELNAAVDELAAKLRTLKNFAEQRADDGDDSAFWKALGEELKTALEPLDKLEKLNRLSGGAPNAEREVAQTAAAFNALWNHRRESFAQVADAARGLSAVLESDAVDEAKSLRERGMNESDAPELAVRKLLNRIGNAARKTRPENRELVAAKIRPLFHKRREANQYFNNNFGAIYRSPFSRSIHQPFALDWESARKVDWPAEMERAAATMESRLANGHPDDFRDWMEFAWLAMSLRLRGLPDELPRGRVPPLAAVPAEAEGALRFSPALAAALRADPVSRGAVVSAFNQLQSALRGLAFKVMRPDFIVRVVFHPIGQDELICAPKDRMWTPPDRCAKKFAGALSAVGEAKDESGAMNTPEAVAALIRARRPNGRGNGELSEADRAFLAEAPHDWLFPTGKWNINAPSRPGIIVFKDAAKKTFAPPKLRPALRLVGPPSLKSALDDCLRGRVVLGESNLILECRWTQRFQWKNGELALRMSDAGLRAELAVPVMSAPPVRKGADFHDRVVAIDLGERGIGYAAFSVRQWLETGNDSPLQSGTIPVPSIRALIRAVRRHRGRAQPGQKVRDSHSRALEKRRKNVVGDVCHAIDSLCAKWRAFPVLEGDVSNLESGESQLKLVYGSVVRRYTFSPVDAHKRQRGEHWFTGTKGGKWPHPFLIRAKRGADGREKREPLNLFPGTQVSAAGTSQECSRCRRNALKLLRDAPDNLRLVFRNGEADLAGDAKLFPGDSGAGKLFLYEKTTKRDPRELRKLKRRKERPQLFQPLNGIRKAAELRSLVKFNLRRPPVSARSRDTSQSRYFCVFADCRAETHADENAAVNIGRRLLSNMDREQSRKKAALINAPVGG